MAAEPCDVLVIGGGPAGCTAAALLAEGGTDVVLLEKDAHPRFHIGESLLPRNMAVLHRLGVAEQVAAMGVYKPGAEFVSDETGQSVAFRFADARVGGENHAYQVVRSAFDEMLFATARAKGARAAERVRVTEVAEGEDGRLRVTAVQADGALRVLAPRFVLDASGRDTFMAARQGTKRSDKRNTTAAVFAHYRGVAPRGAAREGFITVHLVPDGWFWTIPLPDGVTSVGFVGDASAFRGGQGPPAALLERRIADSPSLEARMAGAERLGEVRSTGNYSYRASRAWGDRWLMIGDAFGFLDPVFSSGVLLAMTAGELGAETARAWLASPRRGAAMARRTERQVRGAMDRIGWMIARINDPVLRELFLAPSNRLGMRDGIISLLAGHLRSDRRTVVPVLAFKAVYRIATVVRRFRPRQVAAALPATDAAMQAAE